MTELHCAWLGSNHLPHSTPKHVAAQVFAPQFSSLNCQAVRICAGRMYSQFPIIIWQLSSEALFFHLLTDILVIWTAAVITLCSTWILLPAYLKAQSDENMESCLIASQATGPSSSELSTLAGSSRLPGFQTGAFPCSTWRCLELNLAVNCSFCCRHSRHRMSTNIFLILRVP